MLVKKWLKIGALTLLAGVGVCLIIKGFYLEEQTPAPITQESSEETEDIEQTDPYYTKNPEDMELLEAYEEYNADVVGYIQIPGTVLDHPLMQTKDDEQYYLNHDLDKKVNSHGIPFLSKDSKIEKFGRNMVVYGHNIHKISRDVFCDLAYYEDLDYYKEHPIIETISASGTRRWLIFAYFIVDNSDEDPFRYSDYTEFRAKKDFEEFMQQVQERNWLNVPVDIEYGDTLITLSSCSLELSGSGTNRMVVIGKLLRTDEDVEQIVADTTKTESPLLPKKLQ